MFKEMSFEEQYKFAKMVKTDETQETIKKAKKSP